MIAEDEVITYLEKIRSNVESDLKKRLDCNMKNEQSH